ncbi:MAG: aspartate/tyrosine/aromatic aminotransferase [Gammaproteobacteria bacterium]|jgi:aspartate aminotransferase|nr:aspartate/tyrosine/aromatic aminotransferase [Gammaproteobacteria bacterium]MBT3859398.1 aspartate/tyrosine/aromatic aminotransferase [Gammaproteobacteria bacterium]MBT3988160.1 aspartate/tyrosine/aromatic aminotransferase [Gammaproteobacteria bacterium]MBT4583375.1 aspartate/tyrosine/aromatic aminotransferase [Gammaproteobacteria bacterium]MBT4658436.1 aspartate/tyrosine/aromatic aminotransferase [Gammaproteobacteria bacterium]
MFQSLKPLPADPILGLMAAYRADTNPKKIDLGIGVYKDEKGNTPVMTSVKKAEDMILQAQLTKSYVGPTGAADYNDSVAEMILGTELKNSLAGRRITVQSPGGCGGLRLAAEFLKKASPDATVWVSDPTWANHVPLLGEAGLNIEKYPYYDYDSHSVRFDEMAGCLSKVGSGDLVLLHGCCHNPCGADLNQQQWQAIRDIALDRGFTVFIDLAYQGLGDGLEEDVYGVRLLAESLPELVVVSSCSKNFGLYRERVGAMTLICDSDESAKVATTVVAAAARAMYSMPPDHGAAIVQLILNDADLRKEWDAELTEMRNRINGLRAQLVTQIQSAGIDSDFSFIEREKGMFSFLGVNVDQVQSLVNDYSIYLVNSSRINVAGVNDGNIAYLADSLATVLKA